jgi:DNA-binding MarR family transcriptional regulator
VTSTRGGIQPPRGEDAAVGAFLAASRTLVGVALRSIEAAPVPLTVPQHRVLVLVSDVPRRVGELAAELGVNQSNASRVVDRLVAAALVERAPDPGDRRACVVRLTDTGRGVLERVNDHRAAQLRALVERMSPEARQQAVSALAELDAAARQGNPGAGPTVRDVMLPSPKVLPADATVADVRRLLADDHVHMALLTDTGRVPGRLLATVVRDDLPPSVRDERPAVDVGGTGGRTVPAAAPVGAVHSWLLGTGMRRVAVVDGDLLVGLLCLKRHLRGFCDEDDVLARASEQ